MVVNNTCENLPADGSPSISFSGFEKDFPEVASLFHEVLRRRRFWQGEDPVYHDLEPTGDEKLEGFQHLALAPHVRSEQA
jgi:hypothetical protein